VLFGEICFLLATKNIIPHQKQKVKGLKKFFLIFKPLAFLPDIRRVFGV